MLKQLLRMIGIDFAIRRFPIHESFGHYLRKFQISTVLDIGANEGQFAEELRSNGFKGRIVSFEPLSTAYGILKRKAMNDKKWECHNFALGEEDAPSEILISSESVYSSFLEASDTSEKLGYGNQVIGREQVFVRSLDDIWESLACKGQNCLLKVDTQGFEMQVLRGARKTLSQIHALRMELALRPMYRTQAPFDETLEYLRKCGFGLVELTKVCRDQKTLELLEVDGLFTNFRILAETKKASVG